MESNTKFQFFVPSELSGLRLDRALATHDKVCSRSRAQKLIENGHVTLHGTVVKASHKVSESEIYDVTLAENSNTTPLEPYDFPLDILFEDAHLLVVNKPASLVVHPSAGHANDTLVNALIFNSRDLSMGFNEQRPGIVHRLDKDTSGLLVVAKNDQVHENLADQFRKRTVERIYWALVFGVLKEDSGTIESHLTRHPVDRKRFASARRKGEGKRAVTHYRCLKRLPRGVSFLECRLETGRTHQIRVHLSEMQHPILGDKIYGSDGRCKNLKSVELRRKIKQMQRIALHARTLGFVHPTTQEKLSFEVDWPADLKPILQEVGLA